MVCGMMAVWNYGSLPKSLSEFMSSSMLCRSIDRGRVPEQPKA